MNRHLSAEQITNWIVGERPTAAEQHLRDCPGCRAEVVRFDETLSVFRTSVRSWGGQAGPVRWERPPRFRPLRWVLVPAAVLILATVPVYREAVNRRREVEQAAADARLMEQVDAAVARTVPAPMEPLMKLVSWDSGPAKKGEKR